MCFFFFLPLLVRYIDMPVEVDLWPVIDKHDLYTAVTAAAAAAHRVDPSSENVLRWLERNITIYGHMWRETTVEYQGVADGVSNTTLELGHYLTPYD